MVQIERAMVMMWGAILARVAVAVAVAVIEVAYAARRVRLGAVTLPARNSTSTSKPRNSPKTKKMELGGLEGPS